MKPGIILIGGGGHCRSCIDVIEQENRYKIAGIVDVRERVHQEVSGYEILYTDGDLEDLAITYKYFLITVGQIKSSTIRRKLFESISRYSISLPVIISPLAYVSPRARIKRGSIVMHHAVVSAGAVVGENCIVNTKALLEHDVVVGDHCHISTAAVLNGGVKLDSDVFVGSNAVCRENIRIGSNTVISCNARVMGNIHGGDAGSGGLRADENG